METPVETKSLSTLRKRLGTFITIIVMFLIMSSFEASYNLYSKFYFTIIKGLFSVIQTFSFGKLHLVILIIVLLKFLRLFSEKSLQQFFIKLFSGVVLIINLFFILWGFNYCQSSLPYKSALENSQLIELNKFALLEMVQLRSRITDDVFVRGTELSQDKKSKLMTQLKIQTDSIIPGSKRHSKPVPFFKDGGLRLMGIGGMYFPFSGEALYDGSSPLLRKTFTFSHEYFHSQSVTGEDECNYLAWKTLAESDNENWQYAAYFNLFFTTSRLLELSENEKNNMVSEAVRLDVEFLKEEQKKHSSWFHSFSSVANNSYLKILSSREGDSAYDGYVKWVHPDLFTHSN